MIDLWYVRTKDVVDDAATVRACASLLLPNEQVTHDAFKFDRHRHEYLITRALVRIVLGQHYLRIAPADLVFKRNAYGRPELVLPLDHPQSNTRFNLTNTTQLVVCAVVSDGREIGVDAEPLERAEGILEIVDTVFTPHERDMLARLELSERHRRAVELWTIKEAYMKARSIGMSLPVEQFEAHFSTSTTTLRFFDSIDDDPARWNVITRELEDHLVSLCVERGANADDTELTIHRLDLAGYFNAVDSKAPR